MSDAVVTETSFHGWDATRLSNGLITAIAVPEIGGRLMQFSLGSYQYLFMNPELFGKRFTYEEHAGDGSILNWKNYGGDKTWPAPQGWERNDQWPGPPDPVLDSGCYEADYHQTADAASLTMISSPDTRSGLRIHRTLTLHANSSRLQLDLSFENISNRTIRWSIWDVAQIDCASPDGGVNTDCWLYVPTDPLLDKPYRVMFGEDNPQFHPEVRPGLMAVNYQGVVSKIGVHSAAGWIAFANQQAGYVLCVQFPYEDGADYPDDGATVECWTESPGAPSPIPIRSPGYLLEAEVLGPLHTLQPAERTSQTIRWCAARCPAPILDVTDVGCVHQPLRAVIEDSEIHLTGVFGCFVVGHAELKWLDKKHAILDTIKLGAISPRSALRLDRVDRIFPGTAEIRLNLVGMDGAFADTLASTTID